MLKKWLFLPLLAATLLQIIGCGDRYEYEGTYYEVRGGGTISDTTAIILRIVTDKYDSESPGAEYRPRERSLNLVDMRFEKIYWKKDIVSDDYSNLEFDIIDSTLFFYTYPSYPYGRDCAIGRIAVVHMDEKFHQSQKIEIKYKKIELKGEGWKSYAYPKVRYWKNGLILANSKYWDGIRTSNHYALLDTVAWTMELWQPTGEFEWLNECADYKWSQIGGLCLKNIPPDSDYSGFILLKNGADTLAVRYYTYTYTYTSDRRFSPVFSGNSIISTWRTYPINQQGQVSENHLNVLVGYGVSPNRFLGSFNDLNWNELVDYNGIKFLH